MVLKRCKNLLIELGTEELPPKSVKLLGDAFADNFFKEMVSLGMVDNKPEHYQPFVTPRRLAVWVKGVKPHQVDRVEQKRGPSIKVAFDENGKPTPAILGFAKSCGVEVKQLKKIKTDQGEWIGFEQKVKGGRINDIVGQCLQKAIKLLPIAKRMRWGNRDVEFVRPVHWLLALYGSDVLKLDLLGLKSNRITYGHRVHSDGAITIPSADRYEQILKMQGFVISDYQKRKDLIVKQLSKQIRKAGAKDTYDELLLEEVCGLVEWPVVMVGTFEERFIKLPKEVLKSTMVQHQKYFYMEDQRSRLMAKFAFVSNVKSRSPKRVRQGNERVLRARLSDAEFFWQSDQKMKLEDRVEMLKGVLFHQKLGSIYDKTERIKQLSLFISAQLGADRLEVKRAALLCKMDLVTEMVGEFPQLQGVMGKYYARHQKESNTVAKAIEQHYLPRFSGDKIAEQKIAQCIAIADRIDTLTGIFLCGAVPSGEKDPYALRRSALGVLRTLIERKLNLDITELVTKSTALYYRSGVAENSKNIVLLKEFINERLKGYLQKQQGYSPQQIEAVLAVQSNHPLDVIQRLNGLRHFLSDPKADSESLIATNKRIANMLSNVEKNHLSKQKLDKNKLADEGEKKLFSQLQRVEKKVADYFQEKNYTQGLALLSSLKPYVDQFFDEVTIMHKDKQIRENRLMLLYRVRVLFLGVADISQISLND